MGQELRPRPPGISQGQGPRCWAASFTSWLAVNKNRRQLNQQQLIERYGDKDNGGSIQFGSQKWLELCDDMKLHPSEVIRLRKREDIDPKITDPLARAKIFNDQAQRFQDGTDLLLFTHGHLLLVFAHTRSRLHGTISHMVVVFGTKVILEEVNLTVMDPAKGGYRPVPIFELLTLPLVLLMTNEVVSQDRKPFPSLIQVADE